MKNVDILPDHERMLMVFDNDSIGCVTSEELRRRLHLTSTPPELLQRRRSNSKLIRDLLLPTPYRTWCTRTGGQLKTRATSTKAGLELLSGP